jgi:hypothetical protein
MMKVPKIFEHTTEERMVKHFIQSFELLLKLRFPACSELAGKKVEQGLTIFDFTHGSVTTVNKQVYKMIKMAANAAAPNYPEISG